MMKDLDLCNGSYCPLKMTCWRYLEWLSLEPNEESCHWEMTPAYKDGKCELYENRDYYGG